MLFTLNITCLFMGRIYSKLFILHSQVIQNYYVNLKSHISIPIGRLISLKAKHSAYKKRLYRSENKFIIIHIEKV